MSSSRLLSASRRQHRSICSTAHGRLVDRTGAEVPFRDGGDCTIRRDLVAVHVGSQFDDPSTPGHDRSLIVWGLAADDVEKIEIIVGDKRRVTTPGRDGAFIVSTPKEGHGNVSTCCRGLITFG